MHFFAFFNFFFTHWNSFSFSLLHFSTLSSNRIHRANSPSCKSCITIFVANSIYGCYTLLLLHIVTEAFVVRYFPFCVALFLFVCVFANKFSIFREFVDALTFRLRALRRRQLPSAAVGRHARPPTTTTKCCCCFFVFCFAVAAGSMQHNCCPCKLLHYNDIAFVVVVK